MMSNKTEKIEIHLADGSVYLPGNTSCLRAFALQGRKPFRRQVGFMFPGVKPVNHTRSSIDQSLNMLTCVFTAV